jgi:hypothetical protein
MGVAVAVEEAVELPSPFSLPWRSLSPWSPLVRQEPLNLEVGLEPLHLEKKRHRHHCHHSWRR